MKHNLNITIILVILFLCAQFIGLLVTNLSIDKELTEQTGQTSWITLPLGLERPDLGETNTQQIIQLAIIIAIVTVIALFLIRFKASNLWKYWFLMGVIFTLLLSFYILLKEIINPKIALQISIVAAILLAIFKVFKSNVILHNFTELFIYSGLAIIFVPILNLFAIIGLLILISIYDFIAVRKTKHMVSMAKFQSKTKVFAGLLIPYGKKEAILGGGDIGFPLLFAGVVLKIYGVLPAIIVAIFAALALFYLFMISKKDTFYPAMPFITVGCLLGYAISLLIF